MKKFNFTLCIFLLLAIFTACERPDYLDEIYDTYREAKRNSTSGVVIDGNMWSAMSTAPLDWDEAVSYCKYLTELEYYDWRLPTVNELRTLIQNCSDTEPRGFCNMTDECLAEEISEDYVSYYTRCDNNYCYCEYTQEEGFYSKLGDDTILYSSTETGSSSYVVAVSYTDASIDTRSKSWGAYVRCVR